MSGVPTRFRQDWERLWDLAEQLSTSLGGEPATVFGPIGLLLEDPAAPDRFGGYLNSPLNTATFATTGADGTHFGVIRGGADVDVVPVVMTVPMQVDDPNHIVGTSLPEFLALGCVSGFQSLDSLAYAHTDLPREQENATLLHAIATAFDLEPWPDIATRLHELQTQYSGDLLVDYADDQTLADGRRAHEILMARQAAYDADDRSR